MDDYTKLTLLQRALHILSNLNEPRIQHTLISRLIEEWDERGRTYKYSGIRNLASTTLNNGISEMSEITAFKISESAKRVLSDVPRGMKSIVVSRLIEEWDRGGRDYSILNKHPSNNNTDEQGATSNKNKPKLNITL